MEKIVKSARQTKKAAFVVAMISLGIALVWTVLATIEFVMSFDAEPEETTGIRFGGIAQYLECDESMHYDVIEISYLYDLHTSLIFGLFGLSMLMISKINRDLEKEGPFGNFFINHLGKKMGIIVACGVGYALYRYLWECYACEKLNYNALATSGKITKSVYCGDFPLIALIVIAIVIITTVLRILRYGAELQKQADETL